MIIREHELLVKTKEYKDYIDNHRKMVQKAWEIIKDATVKYGEDSWGQHNNCHAFTFISLIIEEHDKSKYSPEEFEAYRKRFYPVTGEEYDKNELQRAWGHHLENNLHHWQSMKAVNYNHPYILEHTVEMICDWFAMAMQFNEGHRDYYENNKDKIELQDWQHELVEEIYCALDKWTETEGY